MTEEERQIWKTSYDKDGDIYRLNVTDEERLNEYDEKMVLPFLIVHKLSDEQKAIVLSGKIVFNDVLLKNVIISYKEEKDDFDTCVLNALKILNEYNE